MAYALPNFYVAHCSVNYLCGLSITGQQMFVYTLFQLSTELVSNIPRLCMILRVVL